MKSRITEARRRKAEGTHNCCQAILCTYCDLAGLDADTAAAIASGLGSGMGCGEATCGAITGAAMTVSAVCRQRPAAMAAARRIIEAFGKRNGATVCRRLKGVDTGVPLRACKDCVADAASLLEKEITALTGTTFEENN